MSATLDVPCTLPLTLEPLLRTIAAHAVPGLETCDVEGRTHSKVVHDGEVGLAAAWDTPGAVTLSATGRAGPVEVTGDLVRLARRWLDLDRDVAAVDTRLAESELLRPLVAARPGLRVLGTDAPAGLRAFPRPAVLAGTDAEELRALVGLTRARAATVVGLARAVTDGVVLLTSTDPREVRAALLGLPGVGPWTADYLALRALGDHDAYPADDLVLKRALGVRSGREASALSRDWAPWRAYAVTHLWTQAVYGDARPAMTKARSPWREPEP
ncbi:DNA-3-methyladenine glycosylase family protein [Sanguibacter antarcticus]|uniref:DNA-3-methyladenine glycosylase II n=1 Tax=Sanguibacter antarcticus TaxID=372484 RepID=A0A2A9E178_9MICO|nr:AlkA N-terminal domain-containing protein [Sanguibacter antarcticus]PFG32603.1 DNA-3-methyladenine glycosylase II [Sanguibacter antarcticus]